jgi:hypothetical protein
LWLALMQTMKNQKIPTSRSYREYLLSSLQDPEHSAQGDIPRIAQRA